MQQLPDDILRRYLRVLGLPQRDPSLAALNELVQAHLSRIPFENISKLYRRKHLGLADVPDINTYLEGIERFRFGGTCYANPLHFYSLLASLGYEVTLCAADMRQPDVHMVIMAAVDGREFLIDAGYAAPFLAPMPRDRKIDYVIELGADRYVLRPQDANGCSRLEILHSGMFRHSYLAKPASKGLEDFAPAIADSFRPTATFLNALLLARFWPGRSTVIHNLTLIESCGTEAKLHAFANLEELVNGIERHFGIPAAIAREAVDDLGDLRDAWG